MVSLALPGPAGDAPLCWLWRQEGTWQVALGRRTGACRCFPKPAVAHTGGRAGDPWGGHEAAPVQRLSRRVSDHQVPGCQKGPRADMGRARLLQGHSLSQPWGQAWSGG